MKTLFSLPRVNLKLVWKTPIFWETPGWHQEYAANSVDLSKKWGADSDGANLIWGECSSYYWFSWSSEILVQDKVFLSILPRCSYSLSAISGRKVVLWSVVQIVPRKPTRLKAGVLDKAWNELNVWPTPLLNNTLPASVSTASDILKLNSFSCLTGCITRHCVEASSTTCDVSW